MTISVTHPFVSAKSDGLDTTVVQPSDWNDAHTFTMAGDSVLGRGTGAGAVTELSAPSFGRSILAAASAAAARTLLGVDAAIPSGTAMLFVQTAAPTGWTKSTTHNNKALRVVSGTASSGGTTAFTTVFAARTIAEANLPAHTHAVTDPGHTHTVVTTGTNAGATYSNAERATTLGPFTTSSSTTGITIGNTGSGTAMDFAVQYVDCIIAVKD